MNCLLILVVVLAVLTALLLLPIKINLAYAGGLRLWVDVLFVRFNIIPHHKKKKPEKKPKQKPEKAGESRTEQKPPEAPKPEPKKAEPPEKPQEIVPDEKADAAEDEPPLEKEQEQIDEIEAEEEGLIDRFLSYYSRFAAIFEPFKKILRLLIKTDRLNLTIRIGTDDAANTAVYAGMLWSVAYEMLALVAVFIDIKRHNINVEPIYNTNIFEIEGDCIIRMNLANIIGAAAIAAAAYLKYKKHKKQEE